MSWHNRHLLDISDTFQTFIGHNCWHSLDDSGDYLAFGRQKPTLTRHKPDNCFMNAPEMTQKVRGAPRGQKGNKNAKHDK